MASILSATAKKARWILPGVSNVYSQARLFSNKRHKRLLQHAKGFRGRSKNCFTIAIRRVEKSWQYAYRDRKVKKREWRKVWIQRLGAASRQYGLAYNRFIQQERYAGITLNRKVLSEMAATEPFAFKSVLDVVQHQHALFREQQALETEESDGAKDAAVA